MKQFALAVFLLVISSYNTFGQKKYQIRTVAFYNLENLFDPFDDPNINDEASPIMEIKEMWKFVCYLDTKVPEPESDLNKLMKQMEQMKSDINLITNKLQ